MKPYKIRYRVDDWNKPPAGKSKRVVPGIRAAEYGYTDELLLVSILHDPDGKRVSSLMLDSERGPACRRDLLLFVRQQIDHFLKYHCPEDEPDDV